MLDLFEKTEHPLAIGALVALMMGLRTQEVLLREVRDLDDGGRFLWIDRGKTANAKRHLEVPELLRPYLLGLAVGQPPSAPLFGTGRTGKPHSRNTMWAMVRKLCVLAGVPPDVYKRQESGRVSFVLTVVVVSREAQALRL